MLRCPIDNNVRLTPCCGRPVRGSQRRGSKSQKCSSPSRTSQKFSRGTLPNFRHATLLNGQTLWSCAPKVGSTESVSSTPNRPRDRGISFSLREQRGEARPEETQTRTQLGGALNGKTSRDYTPRRYIRASTISINFHPILLTVATHPMTRTERASHPRAILKDRYIVFLVVNPVVALS